MVIRQDIFIRFIILFIFSFFLFFFLGGGALVGGKNVTLGGNEILGLYFTVHRISVICSSIWYGHSSDLIGCTCMCFECC